MCVIWTKATFNVHNAFVYEIKSISVKSKQSTKGKRSFVSYFRNQNQVFESQRRVTWWKRPVMRSTHKITVPKLTFIVNVPHLTQLTSFVFTLFTYSLGGNRNISANMQKIVVFVTQFIIFLLYLLFFVWVFFRVSFK